MNEIKNNSDERDKLEREILEMENVTTEVPKPKLPDVKLDELEYTPPSDDALAAAAKDSLHGYRTDGVENIRKTSKAEAESLADKRASYESGLSGDLADLGSSYETAARNIDNDVLRRGLARSSIAAVAKSELEGDYAAAAAKLKTDYGVKIAEIDGEISSVGKKLETALNDFNLAYAAKLNEKLNELKAEREKKVTEVAKYNNEIRAKQASLDAQKAKTESQLYSDAIDQNSKTHGADSLSEEERNELYKAIYYKMDAYLGSLSPQEAKLEIRNHTMYQKHLSDYYYYRLYDKYGR